MREKIVKEWPGVFFSIITYENGESCNHKGCLAHHTTHPCENCGRINGKGEYKTKVALFI